MSKLLAVAGILVVLMSGGPKVSSKNPTEEWTYDSCVEEYWDAHWTIAEELCRCADRRTDEDTTLSIDDAEELCWVQVKST